MMAAAFRSSVLVLSALLFAAACDDASGNGGQPASSLDDDGNDGDGIHGGGDDGEDDVPDGQTNACSRYVDCIAAVRPAMLSEVEASVGEDGACWDGSDSTREACDQGCADALHEERWASDGEEELCNECEEDADCDPARPRCFGAAEHGFAAGTERVCVECFGDDDCATGVCANARCVEADVAACVDFAMAAQTPGGDGDECARECLAELESACTATEVCCLLQDGPIACELDVSCIEATCAASYTCARKHGAIEECILDCDESDW